MSIKIISIRFTRNVAKMKDALRKCGDVTLLQEEHHARRIVVRVLRLVLALLVAQVAFFTSSAQARCMLSLVWSPTHVQRVALFAAIDRNVVIRFLGHSSFLLTSPEGTVVLTDPNALYPTDVSPHVITLSNDHYTHSNLQSTFGHAGTDTVILRGSGQVTGKESAAVRVRDVLIERLPSNLAGDPQRGMHAGNGIFLFNIGDLCVAHFGNLRQRLSDEQINVLGRIDVMMVPIDQWTTIGYDEVIDLALRIRPSWIIPMHYDDPAQPQIFAEFVANDERSRHIGYRMLKTKSIGVSRRSLPAKSQVLIMGAPTGP